MQTDERYLLRDPKLFYRGMEAALESAPSSAGPQTFAEGFFPALVLEFREPFGLVSAQLYERSPQGWALKQKHGAERGDHSRDFQRRFDVAHGGSEPTALPWAGATDAGVLGLFELAGEGGPVVALHFDRAESAGGPGEVVAMLSSLEYAISQHLRRRELENLIEQARAIQLSLLPAAPPAFGDFDIAAASVPAQVVGGDFYDLHPLDAETLVLTVADAAGHGLPAALQARDVATGLRMGVERDLKITRTVEKLNRVIHRSGLVTRFVSMVFGELELNGSLSYINAGHPPPLLLDDAGLHELSVGGMLLGPHPEASYKLGFAHVDRGAALVLYSDGVVECGTERGEPFGVERLAQWLADWRDRPAEQAVADLFARLRTFNGAATFEDDVTVVYVRRPRS